jgi:secondary thiamine-phosphate synthase enzyme
MMLKVPTNAKTEVINVTALLEPLAGRVGDGIVVVSTPHTTAALLLCEDDDELREDIVKAAESMFAPLRPFKHIRNNNPNTEAHLVSALANTTLTIVVQDGKLQLGTYQNVLLLEMDGPKVRELWVAGMHGSLIR